VIKRLGQVKEQLTKTLRLRQMWCWHRSKISLVHKTALKTSRQSAILQVEHQW